MAIFNSYVKLPEGNLKQMQVLMCPIQMVHVQMLTSFPQILNRLWRRESEVPFPGCWWCQCPQAHSPPLPARKARVSLLGDLVSQGLCYCVLQKTAISDEVPEHRGHVAHVPQFNVVLNCVLGSFKKNTFLLMVLGTSENNIEVGGCGGN